jgi:hypothetical protein
MVLNVLYITLSKHSPHAVVVVVVVMVVVVVVYVWLYDTFAAELAYLEPYNHTFFSILHP